MLIYWFRGLDVEIGIGPNPKVGRAILDSIQFVPQAADTAAKGECSLAPNPDAMPSPERLTTTMQLDRGGITLNPPPASSQASVPAATIWRNAFSRSPLERNRLILALYSAKLPAKMEPDGSLMPLFQNVLTWVIYGVPRSPNIAGCGRWGVQVFDANSGQSLIASGWAPGP